MWHYLKKHWKINLLIIVLQIAGAGLSVYINVLMIHLGQSLFELDMHKFLLLGIFQLSLWIVNSVLRGASTWAQSKAKMLMNNHVRADIVATILKKNYREYHEKQSGEYLSWLVNDVNQVSGFAWDGFYSIIKIGASVLFSIVALMDMHWSLMVFSLVVAAVMIFVPKLFEKRVESLSESCASEQAKAMVKLKDMLAGLDVLRFFSKTERFIDGNREASEQLENPRHRQTYIQAFIDEGISVVNTICQCALSVFIGILSIQGIIIQAALIGGGNLCGTIYSGLSSLAQKRLAIRAAKPYFDKIIVHAEDDEGIHEPTVTPMKRAIVVDNISFAYDEKKILNNASFRFEKGGKYALIGPSGCGKSTLLKLIMGWLPEYNGKIMFDDRNTRDFATDQIQMQMSYIEQDVFLFNTTIRDNITLGENFTDTHMEKVLRESALEHDLANLPLGLDTPVGEDGSLLSGGQKQRVAIARALIHNRSILLVDEGTSALDQRNADIVEGSLLSNPDLTLILVSHHLSDERKSQFTKVYELETVASSL